MKLLITGLLFAFAVVTADAQTRCTSTYNPVTKTTYTTCY